MLHCPPACLKILIAKVIAFGIPRSIWRSNSTARLVSILTALMCAQLGFEAIQLSQGLHDKQPIREHLCSP